MPSTDPIPTPPTPNTYFGVTIDRWMDFLKLLILAWLTFKGVKTANDVTAVKTTTETSVVQTAKNQVATDTAIATQFATPEAKAALQQSTLALQTVQATTQPSK